MAEDSGDADDVMDVKAMPSGPCSMSTTRAEVERLLRPDGDVSRAWIQATASVMPPGPGSMSTTNDVGT